MSDDPTIPSAHPFQGFDIPRQNWFKMPNNWTDVTADMASMAELKVVEYILKHTWGYQEYGVRKKITNDEFMHGRRRKDGTRLDKGTGLSKPSVIAGLKAAVERGLLIEEIDDSDKARVKKYYSLRMMPGHGEESTENDNQPSESPDSLPQKRGGVKDLNAGVNFLYPEVKKVYPRGKESLPRTEKDTLVRHLQEETNNNNNNASVDLSLLKDAVVVVLIDLGISKKVAQKLAEEHSEEDIREKIDYLEFLRDERPEEVQKPAGWLRKAIEDNYGPPDGYQSPAEREAEAARIAQRTAEERRREQKTEQQFQDAQTRRVVEIDQKRQVEVERIAKLQELYGTSLEERELWTQVLADLELQLPETGRAQLIGSTLLQVRDGKALVAIRNGFMRDWVQTQLSKKIERTLAQQLGETVTLEFTGIQEAEATMMEGQH